MLAMFIVSFCENTCLHKYVYKPNKNHLHTFYAHTFAVIQILLQSFLISELIIERKADCQ